MPLRRSETLALLAFALGVAWVAAPVLAATPDGAGAYAFLRSLCVDFDLAHGAVLTHLGVADRWLLATANGHAWNTASPGAALLWAPFFLLAHVATWALSGAGVAWAGAADGYGPLYRVALGAGSVCYAALAVVLAVRAAAHVGRAGTAARAAAVAAVGTPLLFHAAVTPNEPHAASAFAVALLVERWLAARAVAGSGDAAAGLRTGSLAGPPPTGSAAGARLVPPDARTWSAVAAAAGLAACVHPADAVWALGPALDLVWRVARIGLAARRHDPVGDAGRAALGPALVTAGGALAVAAALLAPLAAARLALFGSPLASAAPGVLQLTHPALGAFLAHPWHGVLTWTPLVAVGAAGLGALALARRERPATADAPAHPAVAAALAVSLAAACWLAASYEWHGGAAFGPRRLTGAFAVVALGLAAALDRAPRLVRPLATACAAWSLLLVLQLRTGLTAADEPLRWHDLLERQAQVLVELPRRLVDTAWARRLDVLGAGSPGVQLAVSAALALAGVALAAALAAALSRRDGRGARAVVPGLAAGALGLAGALLAADRWHPPRASDAAEAGHVRERLDAARDAWDAKPDDVGATLVYVEALQAARRWARSAEVADAALEHEPYHARLRLLAGRARAELGDGRAARDELNKVLVRVPDDSEAAYRIGLTFREEGALETACTWYERAAAANDTASPDARAAWAGCLADRGRGFSALEQVRAALTAAPEHAGAQAMLAELEARYRGPRNDGAARAREAAAAERSARTRSAERRGGASDRLAPPTLPVAPAVPRPPLPRPPGVPPPTRPTLVPPRPSGAVPPARPFPTSPAAPPRVVPPRPGEHLAPRPAAPGVVPTRSGDRGAPRPAGPPAPGLAPRRVP